MTWEKFLHMNNLNNFDVLPKKMYLYSHSLEPEWTSHQVLDEKIIEKFWRQLRDHLSEKTTVEPN